MLNSRSPSVRIRYYVLTGAAVLFAAAALLRTTIGSWKAWLVVLVLESLNEFADLSTKRWPHPGRQLGDSVKDLLLTVALPTLLLVLARCCPRLFVPETSPATNFDPEQGLLPEDRLDS